MCLAPPQPSLSYLLSFIPNMTCLCGLDRDFFDFFFILGRTMQERTFFATWTHNITSFLIQLCKGFQWCQWPRMLWLIPVAVTNATDERTSRLPTEATIMLLLVYLFTYLLRYYHNGYYFNFLFLSILSVICLSLSSSVYLCLSLSPLV